MKWRCGVCGYIHGGEGPPEKCPKCGAPREKFTQLPEDEAARIDRARLTNDLHAELMVVCGRLKEIAHKGIEDDLDPPCVQLFKKVDQAATEIGQAAKAEIRTHIDKGKWG